MAGFPGRITIDVGGIPEVLWRTRMELANLLREEAASESDPRVARKLVAVAAKFEAGQR